MFIGIGRFEMFIPESASLKDKRRVLRSMTGVVRQKFNVAIAEIDHQELWQRTAFGLACVSGSSDHCRQMMAEVERTMERAAAGSAEIVSRDVRVVALEDYGE